MMNRAIVITLFNISSFLCHAQDEVKASASYIDSLNALAFHYHSIDQQKAIGLTDSTLSLSRRLDYYEGEVDALKARAYVQVAVGRIDSARSIFEYMRQISEIKGYKLGISEAMMGLSDVYGLSGNFDMVIKICKQALEINRELYFKAGLTRNYTNLALAHKEIGNYHRSLDYFFKSLKLVQGTNSRQEVMASLGLADLYRTMDNREESYKVYKRAYRISKRQSFTELEVASLMNLASLDRMQGKLDSAKYYYRQSIRICESINRVRYLAHAYLGAGQVMQLENSLDSARLYFLESMKHFEEINSEYDIVAVYNALGENYLLQDALSSAETQLYKAKSLSQKIRLVAQYKQALRNLSDLERRRKNYEAAYRLLSEYRFIHDSIMNQENSAKIASLQAEFEFEYARDSIKMVRAGDQLRLENEVHAKQNAQAVLGMTVGLSVGFWTLIFLVLRRNRRRNSRLGKLNKEMIIQYDELGHLNELKAKFFAIISHDLRSPLHQLFSFGHLMKKYVQSNHDSSLDHIFQDFDNSYHHVVQLMDNVLNWGLIDSGNEKLTFEYINMVTVMDECIKVYQPFADSKNISIEKKYQSTNMTLKGDLTSMQMIFRNLLSNAIKFSPGKSVISIHAFHEASQLKVEIKDEGIGIPEEKISLLFEMDESKNRKGTEGEKGIGLGLKLVHDFVKMNQGEIEVVSEVGVGTTFMVIFPL